MRYMHEYELMENYENRANLEEAYSKMLIHNRAQQRIGYSPSFIEIMIADERFGKWAHHALHLMILEIKYHRAREGSLPSLSAPEYSDTTG